MVCPAQPFGIRPPATTLPSWAPISVSAFSASFTFLGCAFRLSDKSNPAPKAGLGGKIAPPSSRPQQRRKCMVHTIPVLEYGRQESHPKNYRNIAFLPAEERQKLVLSFLITSTLLISQKMRYISNQIQGNLRGTDKRNPVTPPCSNCRNTEKALCNCRDFRKLLFLVPELLLDSRVHSLQGLIKHEPSLCWYSAREHLVSMNPTG